MVEYHQVIWISENPRFMALVVCRVSPQFVSLHLIPNPSPLQANSSSQNCLQATVQWWLRLVTIPYIFSLHLLADIPKSAFLGTHMFGLSKDALPRLSWLLGPFQPHPPPSIRWDSCRLLGILEFGSGFMGLWGFYFFILLILVFGLLAVDWIVD